MLPFGPSSQVSSPLTLPSPQLSPAVGSSVVETVVDCEVPKEALPSSDVAADDDSPPLPSSPLPSPKEGFVRVHPTTAPATVASRIDRANSIMGATSAEYCTR